MAGGSVLNFGCKEMYKTSLVPDGKVGLCRGRYIKDCVRDFVKVEVDV